MARALGATEVPVSIAKSSVKAEPLPWLDKLYKVGSVFLLLGLVAAVLFFAVWGILAKVWDYMKTLYSLK